MAGVQTAVKKEVTEVTPSLVHTDKTQELLEKNLKWSQLIFEQNKKIQRSLTWMLIGSYLKLLIVVIPLIIAAIYLPPLLGNVFSQYQAILGTPGDGALNVESIISNFSADEIKGALESLGQ